MADGWTLVSTQRTPQVLSATEVIDAMQIGFITQPSNVYAQRMIPYSSWTLLQGAAGLGFWVAPVRDAVENAIADGSAIGATFVQDVDPASGLLTDFIDFLVGYTPRGGIGQLTDTVRWPIDNLTINLAGGTLVGLQDALDAARARLVALSGG
jgi:hypothetical protein